MTQYSNIVITPVYGPLSHKTAGAIPYHSYGVLPGIRPNPPKFGCANSGSDFSAARNEFMRARATPYTAPTNKYIAPQASSMLTSIRKRAAVGKSSYKVGLPSESELAYKSMNKNDVYSALRKVRGGGCVAPKKAGHHLWKV
jgi:hypothetical protein